MIRKLTAFKLDGLIFIDKKQPVSSNLGVSYFSDAMQIAIEDAEAHQMVA